MRNFTRCLVFLISFIFLLSSAHGLSNTDEKTGHHSISEEARAASRNPRDQKVISAFCAANPHLNLAFAALAEGGGNDSEYVAADLDRSDISDLRLTVRELKDFALAIEKFQLQLKKTNLTRDDADSLLEAKLSLRALAAKHKLPIDLDIGAPNEEWRKKAETYQMSITRKRAERNKVFTKIQQVEFLVEKALHKFKFLETLPQGQKFFARLDPKSSVVRIFLTDSGRAHYEISYNPQSGDLTGITASGMKLVACR